MKKITLTTEELNELLQAMQAMQDKSEFSMQQMKDSYTLNIIVKDGLILVGFNPQDGELVLFNIVNKEGKLLFVEEVIFIFINRESSIIKAGTKSGKIIEIDNIISK